MKKQILLIDYHVGNIQSVINALEYLDYNFVVSNSEEEIEKSDAYILPGVGAFGEAMYNLESLNIIKPLEKQILVHKKPIIGFCLGMQVLAKSSEEDTSVAGLGWINAKVVKFKPQGLVIPHVGWNSVKIKKKNQIFSKINNHSNYYFDHSYYMKCDIDITLATCTYGERFAAIIRNNNIFGLQFHPEKSQTNGLKLLRGFFSSYKI